MESEEILSRLDSPFSEWRPTPRQESYLQLPYEIFEALYGGALGGGKSEVGLIAPIVLQTVKSRIPLYQHPEFKALIFRRTFPQLKKSLIPRAKLMYEAVGAIYNETDKVFQFPDRHGILKAGGKVWLAYMELDKDAFNYDTDEYNYVFIDQAEQFSEFQLRYIPSRIRSSNPDLPAIYRLSANPGGQSHVYLRKRFVEPEKNGGVVLFDKVTKTHRIFIPARLEDNPHLTKNDPGYQDRLQLLPENERASKISGDWFTFTGQKFSEFRPKRIPGEPENAVHTCTPFVIPSFWPKILAGDWGFKAKTFFSLGAISPNKRLYIIKSYSAQLKTTKVWATDVNRIFSEYDNIVRITLDPSAWQERGHERTIAQEFEEYSGFIPEKADNDRHSGVSLIHEYLRYIPIDPKKPEGEFNLELANRILRLQGLQAYKDYIELFSSSHKLEDNLPLLQIFDNSSNAELIDAIPLAQYDEKDKEDYAEFDGDDPIDMLRYLLKCTSIYIDDVLNKTEYFQKEAEILRDLENNKDMHSFYMRMNYLEKKKISDMPKPFKRLGSHVHQRHF